MSSMPLFFDTVQRAPAPLAATEMSFDGPVLRLLSLPAQEGRACHGWREGPPGARIYQNQSRSGRWVEVYAQADGLLECFWSNGEHWACLTPDSMRQMVDVSLARDAFPSVLGY